MIRLYFMLMDCEKRTNMNNTTVQSLGLATGGNYVLNYRIVEERTLESFEAVYDKELF